MLLKQTIHFQVRLIERGIQFEHVKQAIKDPDFSMDTLDGKTKIVKNIGSIKIVVICYRERFRSREDVYRLITAYYIQT